MSMIGTHGTIAFWKRVWDWWRSWGIVICGTAALIICIVAFGLEKYSKEEITTTIFFSGHFKVGSGEWQRKSCSIELEGKGEIQTWAAQLEQRAVWIIALPDVEPTVMEHEGVSHDCGWKATAIVGQNMVTCVPKSGPAYVSNWSEVVSVGIDPSCVTSWLCEEVLDAPLFWDVAERWESYFAGLGGLDWWLPGESLEEN